MGSWDISTAHFFEITARQIVKACSFRMREYISYRYGTYKRIFNFQICIFADMTMKICSYSIRLYIHDILCV